MLTTYASLSSSSSSQGPFRNFTSCMVISCKLKAMYIWCVYVSDMVVATWESDTLYIVVIVVYIKIARLYGEIDDLAKVGG